MFRKEEQAVLQWSQENVELCARRQQDILEEAAGMLRPGGVLVYSTCTFAPEEDEESVVRFLLKHSEFSVKKTEAYEGFAPGRPEWVRLTEEEKEGVSPERLEEILASVRDTFRVCGLTGLTGKDITRQCWKKPERKAEAPKKAGASPVSPVGERWTRKPGNSTRNLRRIP